MSVYMYYFSFGKYRPDQQDICFPLLIFSIRQDSKCFITEIHKIGSYQVLFFHLIINEIGSAKEYLYFCM